MLLMGRDHGIYRILLMIDRMGSLSVMFEERSSIPVGLIVELFRTLATLIAGQMEATAMAAHSVPTSRSKALSGLQVIMLRDGSETINSLQQVL